MARSKSTTGGKGNRKNPEANGAATPASANEAKTVMAGSTAAEAAAAGRHESIAVPENRAATESRKLEVVKSETRKNVVVPINLEDEIRRRAYEIYEKRGNQPGNESEDWLVAEREVRQRYQQQHTA